MEHQLKKWPVKRIANGINIKRVVYHYDMHGDAVFWLHIAMV